MKNREHESSRWSQGTSNVAEGAIEVFDVGETEVAVDQITVSDALLVAGYSKPGHVAGRVGFEGDPDLHGHRDAVSQTATNAMQQLNDAYALLRRGDEHSDESNSGGESAAHRWRCPGCSTEFLASSRTEAKCPSCQRQLRERQRAGHEHREEHSDGGVTNPAHKSVGSSAPAGYHRNSLVRLLGYREGFGG